MITPPIRMAVFDMAGTTVDEDQLVYKTILAALGRAGYATDLATIRQYGAGKEKSQAIRATLAVLRPESTGSEEEAGRIYADFRASLTQSYTEAEVRPKPGAEPVFQALHDRGIKVVLNTGYDRATVDLLLGKLGWRDHPAIDLVVAATEVPQGRPAPDMIFHAMQTLGITDAATVAKIGDTMTDIEEGRNAGCGLVVGITTGAHSREQLERAKPTVVVDSLREFLALVGGL